MVKSDIGMVKRVPTVAKSGKSRYIAAIRISNFATLIQN